MIGLYSKAIGATVVAVLVAVIAAKSADSDAGAAVTSLEVLGVLLAGLVSLGAVWAIPMGKIGGVGKAVTACLVAGVGYLIVAGVWPPTLEGVLGAVIAAFAAAGVTYVVPNAPASQPV